MYLTPCNWAILKAKNTLTDNFKWMGFPQGNFIRFSTCSSSSVSFKLENAKNRNKLLHVAYLRENGNLPPLWLKYRVLQQRTGIYSTPYLWVILIAKKLWFTKRVSVEAILSGIIKRLMRIWYYINKLTRLHNKYLQVHKIPDKWSNANIILP